MTPVRTGLTTVRTWDVTFAGADGHPIRGWSTRLAGTEGAALPAVVEYLGYGEAAHVDRQLGWLGDRMRQPVPVS